MKSKILLLSVMLFAIAAKCVEVEKNRDKIRWGYGAVHQTNTYDVDADGNETILAVSLTCTTPGSQRCKADLPIAFSGNINYNFGPVMNELFDESDIQIESGDFNGVISKTVVFIGNNGELSIHLCTLQWLGTDEDNQINQKFKTIQIN